jgi:hypothetical protein
MPKRLAPLLFALLAITLTALPVANAYAATPNTSSVSSSGNALRVSPVRTDLTIKPGESQTIEVGVTNLTKSTATLHALINDFGAGTDESGTPKIYLDDNSYAPSHGLKRYVDKISDVTVQPGEQKSVKTTIRIPANAAGGGYFGAVRFVPQAGDSSKQLSLSASVASLVLVTVPGNVTEQASISSFNVGRKDGNAATFFTNGKGLQSIIRIKDSGNVQVEPFGKVELRKGGKTLASYEVNNKDPRGSVLPDSIRKFNVDLNNKATSFGKYSLVGYLGYGNKGQLLTASTSFYVVPLPYIIAIVALVIALILAVIIFPRMLKSHDRKLLRKVRGKK